MNPIHSIIFSTQYNSNNQRHRFHYSLVVSHTYFPCSDVPKVSKALRAEFARGDGRIKHKEDDRRNTITPSETLFVVNFQEETTKREYRQMLFEPIGESVRIEMKKNYAFFPVILC